MKTLTPALLALISSLTFTVAASAAPASYQAYCLVVLKPAPGQTTPPQAAINLTLGESKSIGQIGNLAYQVKYSDDETGRKNVVELSITNTSNAKRIWTDVVMGDGAETPEQIDLRSDSGSLSCFK